MADPQLIHYGAIAGTLFIKFGDEEPHALTPAGARKLAIDLPWLADMAERLQRERTALLADGLIQRGLRWRPDPACPEVGRWYITSEGYEHPLTQTQADYDTATEQLHHRLNKHKPD